MRQYLAKKSEAQLSKKRYRTLCVRCLQPTTWCYCASVSPFDPHMTFVVLLHFLELRRRIATGRMSHLSLQGSYLILGDDYTNDPQVNELLNDPKYQAVILQPGADSIEIDRISDDEQKRICPPGKKLLVFVVDGTWSTAFKTIRKSKNLRGLQKISFSPTKPSAFRVRKQPQENYCSTIEAIHRTIDILGSSQGFATEKREHDSLLRTFDSFVDRQVAYIDNLKKNNGTLSYRKKKTA